MSPDVIYEIPSQMDSELKYFEEGVTLNGRFPLQNYLSAASITPGKVDFRTQYIQGESSDLGLDSIQSRKLSPKLY